MKKKEDKNASGKEKRDGFQLFFMGTYGLFIIAIIAFFVLEIAYSFFGISPKMYKARALNENIAVSATTTIATFASTTATATQPQTVDASAVISPTSPNDTGTGDNDSMVLGLIGLLSIYGAVLAYIFQRVIQNKLELEHQKAKETIHTLSRYEREMSEVEMRTAISYVLPKVCDRSDRNRYRALLKAAALEDDKIWHLLEKIGGILPELRRIGDGFKENEYRRVEYRSRNIIAYHLAELLDLRGEDPINYSDAAKAESHARLLRKAIESEELEKLFGTHLYLFKETCAWVDWVLASGTEEQILATKQRAVQEFEKLEYRAPQDWYKLMKEKYTTK